MDWTKIEAEKKLLSANPYHTLLHIALLSSTRASRNPCYLTPRENANIVIKTRMHFTTY